MAIQVGGETYSSYEEYIAKTVNWFERVGDVFSGLDERLDILNKTSLRIEAALGGQPADFAPPPAYTTEVGEKLNVFERIGDALSGVDERLDFLNTTFLRIEQLLPLGGALPILPIPTEVSIADIVVAAIALDIRSFLIMLYRLGRAREVRLFSYLDVDALGTGTYTYTIPTDYIFIPHVEEVNFGLQRVITRYDYEGGNLIHTETYATDRTVEWTMTPLSRVIEGSFGLSLYNGSATDTWIKSRFLGSLMRESDYTLWRRLVRDLSGKYLGFTA